MAPTTRRNGSSTPASKSSSSQIPGDTQGGNETENGAISSQAPSPYHLLIYPVILLIGSVFSVVSPVASQQRPQQQHATAMTPGLSSGLSTPTDPGTPINYFASKHNILNIYFVKILWLWTTLSFALIVLTHYLPLSTLFLSGHETQPTPTASSPRRSNRNKPTAANAPNRRVHLAQSLLRYTLVTLSWYVTTQWFFGPPLIDRSFTLTGGKCALPATASTEGHSGKHDLAMLASTFSSTACKRFGGVWTGGHDISGHAFLLVLSTAFLVLELYISHAYVATLSRLQHPHIRPEAAEQIARSTSPDEKKAMGGWESSALEARARKYVRRFAWTVVALGGWMLLMTAVWFHSLGEKFSGLGLAAGVVWGVYWAGRLFEQWRGVIGGV